MALASPSISRIQDAHDFGSNPGAGNNGYAIVYDHALGMFVLMALATPVLDIGSLTATGFAANDMIRWSGTAFVKRTPAQVLADLGAAAAIHTHIIGNITSLQAALDAKAALVHTHVIGDTTGLQVALDAKAALVHGHVIADVTSLQAALDAKAVLRPVENEQTGTTYTLVLTDEGKIIQATSASAVTLTVPPNSSVAFAIGTIVGLEQYGAGTLTVAPGAGVTIRSKGGLLSLSGQYAVASLRKIGTDEWLLFGGLA